MPDRGYVRLEKLKEFIGEERSFDDDEYRLAILSASRWIDDHCGMPGLPRQFWQEESPSPRTFRAAARHLVCTGDFSDPAGVAVATDDDGDGLFETVWESDWWQAEPFVRVNDHPYTSITTTTRAREFPIDGRRPRVQVTARWGWQAVPPEAAQACQILTIAYIRAKDLTGTEIGSDTTRPGVLSPLSVAEHVLQPLALSRHMDC